MKTFKQLHDFIFNEKTKVVGEGATQEEEKSQRTDPLDRNTLTCFGSEESLSQKSLSSNKSELNKGRTPVSVQKWTEESSKELPQFKTGKAMQPFQENKVLEGPKNKQDSRQGKIPKDSIQTIINPLSEASSASSKRREIKGWSSEKVVDVLRSQFNPESTKEEEMKHFEAKTKTLKWKKVFDSSLMQNRLKESGGGRIEANDNSILKSAKETSAFRMKQVLKSQDSSEIKAVLYS